MPPTRRLLLVSAALLAMIPGCAPPDPGQRAAPTSPSSSESAGTETLDIAAPSPGVREEARLRPPSVDWPGGWRVLEQDAFGRDDDAVYWYRLEAPGTDAAEVARAACSAVAPVIGGQGEPHVARAETAPGKAVAQVRGDRLRASVDVRAESGVFSVLVIVSPPDV